MVLLTAGPIERCSRFLWGLFIAACIAFTTGESIEFIDFQF